MNNSAKGRNRKTSNSKRKREHDLRVAGKSYHTQRGKEIPAKIKSNNEILCNCHLDCTSISPQVKERLFEKFYAENEQIQGTFLMGLIHVIPVNRRRNGKNPEESRRQSTLIYNVPDGEGNHKRVCKRNTRDSPQAKRLLQLHHMKVEKAVECLKKDSEDSCMPGSDVCTLSVDMQQVKKHFVPDDVMNTITTARNKQPFKVVQMKGSYFMDFQQAADMIINTTKVNISSASWIKITTPGVIQIKKTFGEIEEWETIRVLKKGWRSEDFKTITFSEVTGAKRLSSEKKRDLRNMMEYLPEVHKQFYSELCQD
ncbi:hypothetical protein ANN_04948 [Periplaneta americana]|uniref:Uncharacterized protein n=1 Tax=Periplaneta americana TaxID=6978 RepID=A0ABQ8TC72_PERAM|nr:hypothetical protein ANN_04948 [Periplaneta americana]